MKEQKKIKIYIDNLGGTGSFGHLVDFSDELVYLVGVRS